MKHLRLYVACCIVVFAVFSFSETVLTGELKSTTLESSGNPYIINGTITIPKKALLTINRGCVFLFRNYSGIDVQGNIVVKGAEKEPVIFTSYNDIHSNPKAQQFASAFDWNGISILQTSDTVFLENFKVLYSVYGIKSWNNKMIIHNGIFNDNGQYNLTINETIQDVENNKPFTFNYTSPDLSGKDFSTVKPVSLLLYEKKVRKKNIIAFSLLGVGVLGAGGDIYAFSQYLKYRNDAAEPDKIGDLSKNQKDRDFFKPIAWSGLGVSGAFLLASTVTFLIPLKYKDEHSSKTQKQSFDFNINSNTVSITCNLLF
jgi:hypothetical protein